jgi:AcrR family transcriptional regulator
MWKDCQKDCNLVFMTEPCGRRERKKELTRQAILQAAQRLFAERGFHAVTIAEVAEAADVAQQTIFNHFRSKEDLFFGKQDEIVYGPAEAVAARRPDESLSGALRRYLVGHLTQTCPPGTADQKIDRMRVLASSPPLQVRERELLQECEDVLAAALREELGDGQPALLPQLMASQYVAIKRTIIVEMRRRLLAGEPPDAVIAAMVALTDDVFDRLERGLAGVGVRAGSSAADAACATGPAPLPAPVGATAPAPAAATAPGPVGVTAPVPAGVTERAPAGAPAP